MDPPEKWTGRIDWIDCVKGPKIAFTLMHCGLCAPQVQHSAPVAFLWVTCTEI